jgi:hypothetical protein
VADLTELIHNKADLERVAPIIIADLSRLIAAMVASAVHQILTQRE